MTHIILAGPDEKQLGDVIESAGGTVTRLTGPLTKQRLTQAGIEDTDILVLTDVREATAIVLTREVAPEVKIVVYATETIPDFASHLADFRIDPNALDQGMVVEELLDGVT